MTAVSPPAPLGAVRALAAELLGRDSWSREQLADHQQSALRTLLAHAVEHSPHYRATLGPDAAARPLDELPTLTKPTLMEHWDRIVCDPRLRRDDAQAHAAGPDASSRFHGAFEVFSTSGASGLRGLFAYDERDWATAIAATLRALLRNGVVPGMRTVGIGAPPGPHMSARIFASFRAARPDAPRLSVLTPLDELVDALNAFQPEALFGYPSIAVRLADEHRAGRLSIEPRVLAFGSEAFTEDARARVRAAWGIEPGEYYASTELPIVAGSTLAHPHALELSDDLAVIEVVDAAHRPVAPGTPGAKLLLTTLTNRTLPLIRYELEDRVTLGAGPNPTGRPYRYLTAVAGRAADALVLPASGGGTVEILPLRFSSAFAALPAVRAHQIVLHRERLEARVVLDPGAGDDAVRAALREALTAAGAVAPPIDVTAVDALEREPGPAAKLKLVVDRRGG